MCRFKFNNENLINYLINRSNIISKKTKHWNKNIKIHDKLQGEKDNDIEKFILQNLRPVNAFISFKWKEGVDDAEKCLKHLPLHKNITD